jgi:NAD(P)-dependent dehydrogenase (short-subunit alcohol dehydrogenase family)
MSEILAGQVALVTGSARDIGRAIALDLAANGANVVVNYLSSAEAAQEVGHIIETKFQRKAIVVRADVTEPSQAEELVRQTISAFGRIDILVNNAVTHRNGKILKISDEDWMLCVNSCTKSVYYMCKFCLPYMLEKKYGRIINIGSGVGIYGYPGDTAYGAGKAAIIGLTKSLSHEVVKKGITANVVVPGFVKTQSTSSMQQKIIDDLTSKIPMGRPGEPEEIASMVTYLATRGTYVSGQVLMVNGGRTTN